MRGCCRLTIADGDALSHCGTRVAHLLYISLAIHVWRLVIEATSFRGGSGTNIMLTTP
jgi:hypothetical protein